MNLIVFSRSRNCVNTQYAALSGAMTGSRYIIHFYCLAVEASFYSDVVECLPVDPETWVRFPAEAGKIFSLYDTYKKKNTKLRPLGCTVEANMGHSLKKCAKMHKYVRKGKR